MPSPSLHQNSEINISNEIGSILDDMFSEKFFQIRFSTIFLFHRKPQNVHFFIFGEKLKNKKIVTGFQSNFRQILYIRKLKKTSICNAFQLINGECKKGTMRLKVCYHEKAHLLTKFKLPRSIGRGEESTGGTNSRHKPKSYVF